MKRTCRITGVEFEVAPEDLAIYDRFAVPPPTLCPEERMRRRMAFANQRHLFHRNCAGSGKKILSNYPPEVHVPVFDVGFWYSDQWDMFATGRAFDFNRPFFDQFRGLMGSAPRPALQRAPQFDENSDYTNYAGKNKNCYLIFDSDKNEECLYSYSINSCTDAVDCFRCEKCELCYECIDCTNCYRSTYLQDCDGCSESHFLKSCIGCSNCFGCVNLKNKRYFFFNEELSPEEYAMRLAALRLDRATTNQQFHAQFVEYAQQFPHRYMQGVQNESVSGDYLTHSKNAYRCFDSRKLWDCRYVVQAFDDAKDCMDCTEVGDGVELMYECCYAGYGSNFVRFTSHALGRTHNLLYCYFTPFCSNCFGCVGLHHAEYCILNKQYTKEQFETLVPKIIEHMKKTGEWGEFFPPEVAPFPYNLTHASEVLPLTKEEALWRGYQWKDEDRREYAPSSYKVPDAVGDVPDTIVSETLACEESGKNYRIQKTELAFYRKLNIPLPLLCFDERHLRRLKRRNSKRLYERKCAVSGVPLLTTFAPDRPEMIVSDVEFAKLLE